MFVKRAATLGVKVAQSPLTSKIVSGVRSAAGIASVLGVPFAGTVEKAADLAVKGLAALNK